MYFAQVELRQAQRNFTEMLTGMCPNRRRWKEFGLSSLINGRFRGDKG